LVLSRWPVTGMLAEAYGFVLLFRYRRTGPSDPVTL